MGMKMWMWMCEGIRIRIRISRWGGENHSKATETMKPENQFKTKRKKRSNEIGREMDVREGGNWDWAGWFFIRFDSRWEMREKETETETDKQGRSGQGRGRGRA